MAAFRRPSQYHRRWLAIYAKGGLAALLDIYVASGNPLSLAPDVLSSIEQALRQSEGFASYEALRQWVRQTHHLDVKYKTLYTLVWICFKTKLKVPRPSHTKNADALTAFQTDCHTHVQEAIPATNVWPVRVFSQDESHFGLLTLCRRGPTARGVQPVGTI